jgi:alginate O-acetyltransferase complex protein AlgJ
MPPTHRYNSREAEAKAEIGHTMISRATAWSAAFLFLVTIITVPLADQFATRFRAWTALRAPSDLRHKLQAFESVLEDDSPAARRARPLVQTILTSSLHTGTDSVYPGESGWLFYDPDLRHVTGRGFLEPVLDPNEAARNRRHDAPRHRDPLPAILDLRDQLRARGIDLILVPTPVKPTIHPEMLHPGISAPVDNPSFARLKQLLTDRGVLVFDPTPDLVAAASAGQKQYLATDTHWRPEALDLAAKSLAAFVTHHVDLPQSLGVAYRRNTQTIGGRGDLASLLYPNQTTPTETVTIHPILQPDGRPWQPQPDAEILFLGDSFSNIYSAAPMGWGQSAGFAEQLSFHLHRPLDAIRQNDQGARVTRQSLANDLAGGQGRLAHTKLVIWQFATRELSLGDWQPISLPISPSPYHPIADFIVPPTGQSWQVTGRITAATPVPRPGSVAYRDHIRAIHLTDITIESPTPPPITTPNLQAIVYLRSMTDNQLTPAAALQPGQQIRLQLRDWADVSRQYDFIHRTDLPSADAEPHPPCWGELR